MSQDFDLSELGTIENTKSSSTYKKMDFIDLPQGQTTIRFISPKFHRYYNHYINNAYILCLEEDCPICKNNFKLITEFPDNFREVKGWNRRNERYAVNVLDRTPAKVCPKCGTEIKMNAGTFPAICTKKGCSTVIANEPVAPLNKVKVLSKGPTLRDQIVALNTSVLDEAGNPISITTYDVVLNVKGSGKETVITLIPLSNKNEPVDIDESKLFDLSESAIRLTAEEMIEMQQGIALEIFSARKASQGVDKALEGKPEEISDELRAKIDKLMGEEG